MGRLYTEPGDFIRRVYKDHLEEVAGRFRRAFQRALPDLPPAELMWRLHFCIGVMTHTMGAGRLLEALSGGLCDASDVEGMLARIKIFLMAGLTAPVTNVEVQHAMR